jgi:hypothetical protein
MSSEAALQTRILKRIRQSPDIRVIKVVGGPYQESGVSDLILCWRGRFVAIELKEPGRINGTCQPEAFAPKSITERLQVGFLREIIAAGGAGFFTDDYAAVINFLELV